MYKITVTDNRVFMERAGSKKEAEAKLYESLHGSVKIRSIERASLKQTELFE